MNSKNNNMQKDNEFSSIQNLNAINKNTSISNSFNKNVNNANKVNYPNNINNNTANISSTNGYFDQDIIDQLKKSGFFDKNIEADLRKSGFINSPKEQAKNTELEIKNIEKELKKSGIIKENDINTSTKNAIISSKILPVQFMETIVNKPIVDDNIKTLPVIYLNE
jgi:hypothetical protein